ncbi:unnamed protein product [Coffea canephora]|uniref:Uncharacterized protein n=1 Tax=Coffea canephora TaxID=49390 RepID=A0A068UZZ6_COFCA|nr:unnamed protein product [Coffea canephora]
MSTEQERAELDARARQGETVPKRDNIYMQQIYPAKGGAEGGQTRREQLGAEGYHERWGVKVD